MMHAVTREGDLGACMGPLYDLMLINIDANVERDPALRVAIAGSVEAMLERASEADQLKIRWQISRGLLGARMSRQLKCRAITALPASTQRSHHLRRSLALALITDHVLEGPSQLAQHGDAVLDRLKAGPDFNINDSTNYNLLNPLVEVLDLAIDSGFSDSDFRSTKQSQDRSTSSVPAKDPVPTNPSKVANSSPSAEKLFNAQIDAFISQLTLMASRIKDAGTTHLREESRQTGVRAPLFVGQPAHPASFFRPSPPGEKNVFIWAAVRSVSELENVVELLLAISSFRPLQS